MTLLSVATGLSTARRYATARFIVAALFLTACQDDKKTSSVEAPQKTQTDKTKLSHIKEFVSDLVHDNDNDEDKDKDNGISNPQTLPNEPTHQTQSVDTQTKLLLSPSLHSLDKTLPDFSAYRPVAKKKQAFFDYLLPLAEAANAYVQSLRDELLAMDANNISPAQQKRLSSLAKRYKVNTQQPKNQLDALLKKIYPIPTALTLAQAANESGWGSSRFAVQGNNLFGQWCFNRGCGIVPSQRNEDSHHEVQVFSTPEASVAAYVKNLNSHSGYVNFRQIRHCLYQQGIPVLGQDLAYGLHHYSSRGMAYVNEITQLIRQNKLEPWRMGGWKQDNLHPCAELIDVTDMTSN